MGYPRWTTDNDVKQSRQCRMQIKIRKVCCPTALYVAAKFLKIRIILACRHS